MNSAVGHRVTGSNHADQLAHVAGPRVTREQAFGSGRQASFRAVFAAESLEAGLHHLLPVVAAQAQRRDIDMEVTQSEKQIVPEFARQHEPVQRAIRRGDHAHVDGSRAGCADWPELSRRERAQQHRLSAGCRSAISSRKIAPPWACSNAPV